jgi:hypothetical protein
MPLDTITAPKVIQIYLDLSQYPILAPRIRHKMRQRMFERHVVDEDVFEEEVRAKAIESQAREGLTDPLVQEPAEIWLERASRIRDQLTDFYFAYNVPYDEFRKIVQKVISEKAPAHRVMLTFNPELAPWDLLFAQGEAYEKLPAKQREEVEHHLQEIVAVLIKTMMSDQLAFVRLARQYFTIGDLKSVLRHRIGRGKIGGKAAGLLLAYRILKQEAEAHGLDPNQVHIPDSYFLCSDVYYDFKSENRLFRYMNQKYLKPDDMVADFPVVYEAHIQGRLPQYVMDRLAEIVAEIGPTPLIVRSSSLLEDNFDSSFAGKYDSFFLPNQGTPEQNLAALAGAITKVYASVIRPEVLIYRERMGLTDYDERMAVLIQKVEGQQVGRYFFPPIAGVGFSYNPYRWNTRIRPEDGLVRMVVGLGTQAVDRVGGDYPRMVALSHPSLRPEQGVEMVKIYSQHFMDVLDMEDNEFKSVHVSEAFGKSHPALGAIMSIEQEGMVRSLQSKPLKLDPRHLVVTFENLLERGNFVDLMRKVLTILSEAYGRPVDTEFAASVLSVYPKPEVNLILLQCRPLSRSRPSEGSPLPDDLEPKDILFRTKRQVPDGTVRDIRYIVYVDPARYSRLGDAEAMVEVGRVVGRINKALEGESFVLMGPGRWGSSNLQLGVKVTYADIYNTKVLIEIARAEDGIEPEVSYGTHFFQDLVEGNIYPLPLFPDDRDAIFDEEFIMDATNLLAKLLPDDKQHAGLIRIIDVEAEADERLLTIVMDSEEDEAVGYFA